MGLPFDIYKSDDTTLATGLVFSTSAGVESVEQELHLWANKGTNGGFENNAYLRVRVENPASPGNYVSSGVLALDQFHFSISVTGYSNPSGDASFQPQVQGYTRVGTGKVLWLLPFVGNSCRKIKIRYRPKMAAGASQETINFLVELVSGETVLELANGIAERGAGILRMLRVYEYSGWDIAPTVTAAGSPDATTTVSRRKFIGRGKPIHKAEEVITHAQTDGAGASLTTGKAYIAVLSQPINGDNVTVTKGLLAASAAAVAPAMPADELFIRTVKVLYHSGSSVINTADITGSAPHGRFRPTIGTGLTLTIGAGYAFVGGAWVVFGGESTASLAASSTNEVWITPQGTLAVDTGGGEPPVAGALWIATGDTDGSGVTTLTDRRPAQMSGIGCETIRLVAAAGNATTGDGQDATIAGRHCYVDELRVHTRTPSSGGATGSTTFDVEVAYGGGGYTTMFSAPPSIPAGSREATGWPDLINELQQGDYLRFNVDATTSGGTREKDPAGVLVVCPA